MHMDFSGDRQEHPLINKMAEEGGLARGDFKS